jgi:hypothetical protein
MYGKEGRYVEGEAEQPASDIGETPAKGKGASFDEMVAEARRWKGAAYKADRMYDQQDKRARVKHSEMTTKGDLDDYLMRKFGVDDATARNVSNELTRGDLGPDETANLEDYRGEPWADAALAKQTSQAPGGETPAKAKEPWEMRQREYQLSKAVGNPPILNAKDRKDHEKSVRQAISEGKITSHPDYPELTPKAPEAGKVEPSEKAKGAIEAAGKVGGEPGTNRA